MTSGKTEEIWMTILRDLQTSIHNLRLILKKEQFKTEIYEGYIHLNILGKYFLIELNPRVDWETHIHIMTIFFWLQKERKKLKHLPLYNCHLAMFQHYVTNQSIWFHQIFQTVSHHNIFRIPREGLQWWQNISTQYGIS